MDPVSNIIVNTIWYGATFPMHPDFEFEFQVDMICTRTLMRIECCSLYGLVAFLCARFSTLTEHDALCYLLLSNVNVCLAIKMLQQTGHAICGTELGAYKKAALDSWHPDPDALAKFAVDIEPAMLLHMMAHTLNDYIVERVTMYVSAKSSPTKSLLNGVSSSSEILNENQKMLISAIRKKIKVDQEFYVRKVNAALSKYSKQKGVDYELHVICGVNPKVTEGSSVALFKRKFKFEYFHINFWATPKGSNTAGTAPVLFFAECSNCDKEEKERPSLCYPVLVSWIDDARCFCCERNGIRIVHPCPETYNGRYDDFRGLPESMAS